MKVDYGRFTNDAGISPSTIWTHQGIAKTQGTYETFFESCHWNTENMDDNP